MFSRLSVEIMEVLKAAQKHITYKELYKELMKVIPEPEDISDEESEEDEEKIKYMKAEEFIKNTFRYKNNYRLHCRDTIELYIENIKEEHRLQQSKFYDLIEETLKLGARQKVYINNEKRTGWFNITIKNNIN